MAPTRRVKTARAASQRPPFPPTPSGSEEYSDHDMDPDATYNPSNTHPRASPYHRHSQGAYPLQRGTACLSCRKRKMKCDGSKPVCQQCTKANRAADCEYDDGKSKTRTQLLQEKIQRLESRLHQLEGPSVPPQQQSSNPGGPLSYSASAPGNLVDVPLHSSALAYGSGHPNPISVYGSPRNTPSPPNRQTYFDENMFSAAAQPSQQFSADVFLDPTSADPLSLDYALNGSSGALGFDQIQLLDASNPSTAGLDASASAWEMTTQTLLNDWNEELPPQFRQGLLDLVVPHLPALGLDLHLPTFMQSVMYPPNRSSRPHPCLLNALYLHACSIAPPQQQLRQHENRFLQRTRDAIQHSLNRSDRLLDGLRAQCLLATWYYARGRVLEGYATTSAAARFAVGCELNKIVSPVLRRSPENTNLITSGIVASASGLGVGLPSLVAGTSNTAAAASRNTTGVSISPAHATSRHITLGFGTGLLPSSSFTGPSLAYTQSPTPGRGNFILDGPRTTHELGERILVFWRIFNLDRFWSVVSGLQPALSEDEIMTVWPRGMDDYHTNNVSDNEYASLRTLGIRQPPNPNVRHDTQAALLSKAIALFERAARLSGSLSSAQPPTEAFWVAFRLMEESITHLTTTVPAYRRSQPTSTSRPSPTNSNSPPSSAGANGSFNTNAFDPTLFLVHIVVRAAAIQLHNIFANERSDSYQMALGAARQAAAIVAEVTECMSEAVIADLDIMLGPCLTLVADTLVRESLDRPHNPDPLSILNGTVAPTSSGLGVGPAIDAELDAIVYVLKVLGSRSPLVYRQAVLVDAAHNAAVRQRQQQEQGGPQQQQQQQPMANHAGSISPPLPPLQHHHQQQQQHQHGGVGPLQMISFTAGLA